MDLSFIIVNYFDSQELMDCIGSIHETVEGLDFEIVVSDNSSGKDNLRPVLEKFPAVRLIENPENLGFAKANNLGAKSAKGDTLLFVNPDVILTAGAVSEMLSYLRKNPQTGILGPKVLNSDGSLQYSCRRFPTFWTGLFNRYSLLTRLFPGNKFSASYLMLDYDHQEVREVDWVSGCCMMVPREIFFEVGPFDENYFLFNEDVDLCKSMKDSGRKVVYFPEVRIYHHIGSSNSKLPSSTIIKRHLGMSHFQRKHFNGNFITKIIYDFLIAMRCCSQLIINLFR